MLSEQEYKEIQRLHLRVSRQTDSQFLGEYRTSLRGKGIEYADVRPYLPGDEIRRIDWNVTARTGYPHVKQFKEEREHSILLLVDVSASMKFAGKNKVCSLAAGAIAFAAMRNQDNVGLILFGDTVHKILPPKNKNGYVWRIIKTVFSNSLHTKGTRFTELIRQTAPLVTRNSTMIVLSDFLAPDWRVLGRICPKKNIHGLLVYDELENRLPFSGLLDIIDSETRQTALIDSSSVSNLQVYKRLEALRQYGIKCCSISKEEDVIIRLRKHFASTVSKC